ncbi:MAG: adenine phosphoribosyltransferase [Oscillospiraceae bacterium]|nr:adenine phosphoribosyltransferase [Oscillospiraceae bacterium]
MKKLEDYVENIVDFPEKGIIFRDVSSVFQDKDGLKLAIDSMLKAVEGLDFDVVAGTESRGFLLGMPIAYALNKGFVMVRKKGKLPREVVSKEYELEYGTAAIEIHKDAIKPGDRVLVVDDLIATGGTIKAAAELIEELGGTVAKMIFLIELEDLDGRSKLEGYDIESVIKYKGK